MRALLKVILRSVTCCYFIVFVLFILSSCNFNKHNTSSNDTTSEQQDLDIPFELTPEIIDSNIKASTFLQSIDRKTAEDLVICVYTSFFNNSTPEDYKKCFYGSADEQYNYLEPYYAMCMEKYGF